MKKITNYQKIIGVDISKKELDICLLNDNQLIFQGKVANTTQGLKPLQKQLKTLKIDLSQILFCCENTGIYTTPLLMFTEQNSLNLWVETLLAIKKSLGLTIGKTDRADAPRIAHTPTDTKTNTDLGHPLQNTYKNLKAHGKTEKVYSNSKLKSIKI